MKKISPIRIHDEILKHLLVCKSKLLAIISMVLAVESLSCQQRSVIQDNPVFYSYFQSLPTINLDTEREIRITYIEYKDIDKGVINLGDDTPGTQRSTRLIFKQGKLVQSIGELRANGKTYVESERIVEYRHDSMIVRRWYTLGKQKITETDEFSVTPGKIVAKDPKGSLYLAVLEYNSTSLKIWDSHSFYSKFPDKPDTIITMSAKETVLTKYMVDRTVSRKNIYTSSGVLHLEMNRWGETTYSTAVGSGTVSVKDNQGSIIRTGDLIRKVNDAGFLTYERVKYNDGRGYEWIIEYM